MKNEKMRLPRREFSKAIGLGSLMGVGLLAAADSARAQVAAAPGVAINVRDYGAKGDGIANDQPAIQAAFDSVGTNGGNVVFPPGVYRIDFPIFIRSKVNSTAGFLVSGTGQNCVLQAGSGFPANVAMLYVLGGNASIADLGLDGVNIAQNGIEYAYQAPDLPDDRTVMLSRLAISRMLSNGFICTGGEAYQIRDCFFNSLGGYAVYNHNGGINSFVDGNYMLGCGGVYLGSAGHQVEGFRITNNTILCSAGAGIGVYVDRGLEVLIANNVIDQVLNGSVRITNNASYVKCIGNWLSATGQAIVCVVNEDANSITFADNTFEGGSFQLSFMATAIGRVHTVTVHNNIFNNASNTAMFFNNISRASIIGNHARTSGQESLFWGNGQHGVATANVLWKGPNVGSGLVQSLNIGW